MVRKNHTTVDMLDDAVNNLKTVDANILGVVMIDSKEGNVVSKSYKNSKYSYSNSYASDNRKEK